MSEIIRTQKRDIRYNGIVDSADYNARIEENYQDLVTLYNKANTLESKLQQAFERVIKDHAFLSNAVQDLEDRLAALEANDSVLSLYSATQIDYATFLSTAYTISSTDLLSFDPYYNTISLPIVSGSSTSKVKFYNPTTGQVVPDFFKTSIDNSYSGVDSSGSVVDTTPTYYAILDDPNKIWKRNIVSNTANNAGAQMMFYVKIPTEYTGSNKTNCIKFNPYPMRSVDIFSIEYTTNSNPNLIESDGWYDLNVDGLYNGQTAAIGKVPPGGWATAGSDKISNSGPLCFYFGDLEITAIRIKMNQRNYFKELNRYIYSYGLSDLDIRYDKFLTTGKTIIKFDAPSGKLISEVTNVTPYIYNVPPSLLSTAFSYRVIYEDGGSYTLSNPGSSSSVWIEVTLNMLDDKTPPVLSDLKVECDFIV
jgi:hypothetical protein